MTETEEREYFQSLNSPDNWLSSAQRLRHAAETLFRAYSAATQLPEEEQAESEDVSLVGSATLLFGLALENLLKAALLFEGIATVNQDGTIKTGLGAFFVHDLEGMAKSLSSLCLTEEEPQLLQRLSAFVIWAGKYPSPIAFEGKKSASGGLLLTGQPWCAERCIPLEFRKEDKASFDRIFSLIFDHISPPIKILTRRVKREEDLH